MCLHGVGKRRYDAVRQHFLDHGIQDHLHGNSKKLPHHRFTTAELKCIVSFVKNYAEEMPFCYLVGFPASNERTFSYSLRIQPKRSVWEHYMKSCATLTFRVAAYATFCTIWRKYMPHVVITTPKTDLCWTCQQNSFAITASSNKPDSEKSRVNNFQTNLLMTILIFSNNRF